MQLKWTNLASADLDNIETYITQKNSSDVAIKVIFKIITTTEMILPDHPNTGRTGRVKGTQELVINGIPFIVIYRKVDNLKQIQVLRILHDAQQWP